MVQDGFNIHIGSGVIRWTVGFVITLGIVVATVLIRKRGTEANKGKIDSGLAVVYFILCWFGIVYILTFLE